MMMSVARKEYSKLGQFGVTWHMVSWYIHNHFVAISLIWCICYWVHVIFSIFQAPLPVMLFQWKCESRVTRPWETWLYFLSHISNIFPALILQICCKTTLWRKPRDFLQGKSTIIHVMDQAKNHYQNSNERYIWRNNDASMGYLNG